MKTEYNGGKMDKVKYIIEETNVFVIEAANENEALTKSCMPVVRGTTRIARQVTITESTEEGKS